jgi:hypothetical protein
VTGGTSTDPERVEGLTGTVVSAPFGTGSKSEHLAVWLEAPGRRLVLRRKDGPAFGDRSLQQYVGKRVKCDGFVLDHTLIAERITIVP